MNHEDRCERASERVLSRVSAALELKGPTDVGPFFSQSIQTLSLASSAWLRETLNLYLLLPFRRPRHTGHDDGF